MGYGAGYGGGPYHGGGGGGGQERATRTHIHTYMLCLWLGIPNNSQDFVFKSVYPNQNFEYDVATSTCTGGPKVATSFESQRIEGNSQIHGPFRFQVEKRPKIHPVFLVKMSLEWQVFTTSPVSLFFNKCWFTLRFLVFPDSPVASTIFWLWIDVLVRMHGSYLWLCCDWFKRRHLQNVCWFPSWQIQCNLFNMYVCIIL